MSVPFESLYVYQDRCRPNDLPESQRALRTATEFARASNAELATVSILGNLPAYTWFAIVVDPNAPNAIKEDGRRVHDELHEKASLLADRHGVRAKGSIVEGGEVQAILHFLKEEGTDLLANGLHQHDFYLSRLWSSVYDLGQDTPCSELGLPLSTLVKISDVFQSKWVLGFGGFTA